MSYSPPSTPFMLVFLNLQLFFKIKSSACYQWVGLFKRGQVVIVLFSDMCATFSKDHKITQKKTNFTQYRVISVNGIFLKAQVSLHFLFVFFLINQ